MPVEAIADYLERVIDGLLDALLEPALKPLGRDPKLVEQPRVLLVAEFVWQLLLGLIGLVVLPLFTKKLDRFLALDLQGHPPFLAARQ